MVKPVVNPNMHKTLREVVGRFVGAPQQLSHKQKVQRLYKQSLKTLDSWVIDRRLWNEEATKIRAEFDANRSLDPESGYVIIA
ncbi:NADH dehydrogenase [ubiquinone] 1 beta subcomplex subunit 9 [Phytophthora citrophthora]|uniref:NADH dehydrogenase [ubiquinone] 1 beta subcomplex subunit 9 n=1 Tax=Phytophthora citrophthora TaxID=4793 RepID=A0AAD9GS04_9STRA|nr:NADH dehydrogenase [ubiquinone] 1 beta subcomplex subunit 9 [Phytophthora citrophthora]